MIIIKPIDKQETRITLFWITDMMIGILKVEIINSMVEEININLMIQIIFKDSIVVSLLLEVSIMETKEVSNLGLQAIIQILEGAKFENGGGHNINI